MVALRQFDRACRVTFTPIPGTPTVINPILPVALGAPSVAQQRVQLEVVKSITAEPQRAKLQIFNLSRVTREILASQVRSVDQLILQRPNTGLIDQRFAVPIPPNLTIEAGYAGAPAAVFLGLATRLSVARRGGVDWITTIEAGDASVGMDLAQANRVYAQPVPVFELVAYLLTTMGLVPGTPLAPGPTTPVGLVNAQPIALPRALTGRSRDILQTLVDALDVDWFVEDGAAYFLDKPNGQTPVVTALPGPPVRLSPLPDPTGARLLDVPVRLESDGVRVRTLLNPQIRVARTVALLSGELAGTYRVEQVDHRGDNRGGAFETVAILRSLVPTLPF